jgi:hypothetical protein
VPTGFGTSRLKFKWKLRRCKILHFKPVIRLLALSLCADAARPPLLMMILKRIETGDHRPTNSAQFSALHIQFFSAI